MIPAFYLNVEKAYCSNLGSVCSVLFLSEYLQVLKACFVKKHFLRLHQLFFRKFPHADEFNSVLY